MLPNDKGKQTMRTILQVVSWLALAGTILPSILYYNGQVELEGLKRTMLIATVFWFAATAMWMGRDQPSAEQG